MGAGKGDGLVSQPIGGGEVSLPALPVRPVHQLVQALALARRRGRHRVSSRIRVANRDGSNRRPFRRNPEPGAERGHDRGLNADEDGTELLVYDSEQDQ